MLVFQMMLSYFGTLNLKINSILYRNTSQRLQLNKETSILYIEEYIDEFLKFQKKF